MNESLLNDVEETVRAIHADASHFEGRTVLLCGGAGFLGRFLAAVFEHLNKHVLSKPCRLIVCDNLITGGEWRDDGMMNDVRFLRHNIVEPLDLDEPVDYVMHAAGIASPYYYRKYPLETLDVATLGTRQCLELARKHHVRSFLFFSSSEIYGDPDPAHVPTPESYRGNVTCIGPRACYDESKRLGETISAIYHERYGVPTRIVRPFNVYGPGMREHDYRVLPNFASRIVSGKPLIVYGNGNQTRTFCYISDAVAGFLKVLLNGTPGQPYNIGNPAPEISMLDLAATIMRVVGCDLPVQRMEHPDSYPADEPQRRCPDITKASLQLAFQPRVSLEDGLDRFMRWATRNYSGDL